MAADLEKLIWLFPIAFILHDFEELMLFEAWLHKHASGIRERLPDRVPAFLQQQLERVLEKSTTQFAFPIFFIFLLTCAASFCAAELQLYPPFLLASSLFFLHGFLHIGQAALLHRYVPALVTSVLIVLPYGAILLSRLLSQGVVMMGGLSLYFLAALLLAGPFILAMHWLGERAYQRVVHGWMG